MCARPKISKNEQNKSLNIDIEVFDRMRFTMKRVWLREEQTQFSRKWNGIKSIGKFRVNDTWAKSLIWKKTQALSGLLLHCKMYVCTIRIRKPSFAKKKHKKRNRTGQRMMNAHDLCILQRHKVDLKHFYRKNKKKKKKQKEKW